jgi:hypothetical protein
MLSNINRSYLLYAHADVISQKYYSNIHMQIIVLKFVAVVINCIGILYIYIYIYINLQKRCHFSV